MSELDRILCIDWNLDDLESLEKYLNTDPLSRIKMNFVEQLDELWDQVRENLDGNPFAYKGQTFKVNSRTGRLHGSVARHYPFGDEYTGQIIADPSVGGGVDYGAFIHKGGTISLKRAKAFAIIVLDGGELKFLDRSNFTQYVSIVETSRGSRSYILTGNNKKGKNKGKVDVNKPGGKPGEIKKWLPIAGGKLIFKRTPIRVNPHPFMPAAWETKKSSVIKNISDAWAADLIKYKESQV